MVVKNNIPNALTLINLFSGCTGIVFVSMGFFRLGSICIFISAILDFFDGLVARAFNAYSSIGKDLDSLADIVSFGVLPSFMVFSFLKKMDEVEMRVLSTNGLPFDWLYLVVFIMAVFSALRLARFNHDSGQEVSFRGLPTPANALFWAAVFWGLESSVCVQGENPMLQLDNSPMLNAYSRTNCSVWSYLLLNRYFILLLSVGMAFMLLAPVRLLSFKIKGWSWKENKFRYFFLATSVLAVIVLHFDAAPIILLLYIVFSYFTYGKSFLT